MREPIREWLAAHDFPTWLAPDYTAMLTAALLVGSLVTLYLWRRSGQPSRIACDLLFFGILSLFVGAKLVYFLQYGFPASLDGWWRPAGLSLYGGLLGLLVAWAVYYAVKPYPAGLFLDCATPALALGLFFGRIGCFLAGCNGGIPTDWAWAVRFPRGTSSFDHHLQAGWVPDSALFSLPAHPTQLYESLFGLTCFLLLLALWRSKRWDGQVFFTGMLWYAVFRFMVETIRADAGGLHPLGIVTFAQSVSILLAAIAATGLLNRQLRPGRQVGQELSL